MDKIIQNNTELFNFSLDQANAVLEEYFTKRHIFSSSMETIIVVGYCLLITSGVCSNLLVSSVILKNIKVRTNRNLLIVNLGMSDIALCVFCMPFTLLQLIRRNWPLGSVVCKLVPFIQAATIFVMAGTVTAIAIERHNAILSSTQSKTIVCRKLCLCASAIWILALLLSIPVCIFQTVVSIGVQRFIFYERCMEQWPSGHIKSIYTVVVLLMQFIIPAAVLMTTHCRVRTYLRICISHPTNECTPAYMERLKKELKRNGRATMVLFNLSVAFTASWLPWNIVNLLADFHPSSMSPENLYLVFAISHMIAMSSATTNPILYGWLNTNIKKELMKMGELMGSVLSFPSKLNSENVTGAQESDDIELQNKANSL